MMEEFSYERQFQWLIDNNFAMDFIALTRRDSGATFLGNLRRDNIFSNLLLNLTERSKYHNIAIAMEDDLLSSKSWHERQFKKEFEVFKERNPELWI